MLKISDLTPQAHNLIIKTFNGKDAIEEENYTYMQLVTLVLHPTVDVHLYVDHITLDWHDRTVDIDREDFSTLIFS